MIKASIGPDNYEVEPSEPSSAVTRCAHTVQCDNRSLPRPPLLTSCFISSILHTVCLSVSLTRNPEFATICDFHSLLPANQVLAYKVSLYYIASFEVEVPMLRHF